MNRYTFIFIVALATFISCKKKATDPEPEEENEATTGSVLIELNHKFGPTALTLNSSTYYITQLQDSLKFTTFRYYISNIKLKQADGSYWIQPESYYLVDLDEASSLTLTIPDVPFGEYSELQYTVGVDSTRNVSGAQSGALSTTNAMFWSWNSGYIFLKSEGTYRNGSSSGTFMHHIGGFKNSNNTNAVQTVTHDLSSEGLEVAKDNSPEIHMKVNVATLYNGGPSTINVVNIPTIHMPGANAVTASNNYKSMFTIDLIH